MYLKTSSKTFYSPKIICNEKFNLIIIKRSTAVVLKIALMESDVYIINYKGDEQALRT